MNYRVDLWAEAVSPVTHMKGVEGNEALIARQPVDTPSGKRWVPYLSGNALRHCCIREPGGLWLVEQLGLKGRLSLQRLNFLLHGGNLTDSTGREDTARIAEMQELFPLVRLLGGALPDQILKGAILARHGLLVCEENRPHITATYLPDGYSLPETQLKPSEHFVEGYQYTRGDSRRRTDWYDEATHDPDAKSNLMIFSGQCVIRGAQFAMGFDIPHGSELELGCALHAIGLWQANGGVVGGMGSKGHGRLTAVLLGRSAADVDAAIGAYTAHVAANAERCRAWLDRVFPVKEAGASAKKTDKAGKGKGKKTTDDPHQEASPDAT